MIYKRLWNNQQNNNNRLNSKIWKKVLWKAQDQICFRAAINKIS